MNCQAKDRKKADSVNDTSQGSMDIDQDFPLTATHNSKHLGRETPVAIAQYESVLDRWVLDEIFVKFNPWAFDLSSLKNENGNV